ncbi:hypothetical protein CLOM_g18258, partial [Closterium sp. NIES-68]
LGGRKLARQKLANCKVPSELLGKTGGGRGKEGVVPKVGRKWDVWKGTERMLLGYKKILLFQQVDRFKLDAGYMWRE